MNLEFYQNYIHIVECGTLSAAARELHIAQSALSGQVKAFEQEYGAALFLRGRRQLELTDAGRILYEKAKSITALLDAAHKEIAACEAGCMGLLRVGITPDYTHKLADLLLDFQKQNPQVHYDLCEQPSGDIMERLRTGELEVGLVRVSGALPAFLQPHIELQQRLGVLCRYNNPWIAPQGQTVPVSALHGLPLAAPRCFSAVLADVFERSGAQPQMVVLATSRDTPVLWARSGAALAILCAGPEEENDTAEFFFRPLSTQDPIAAQELLARRTLVTAKGRAHSAAAQHFLEYCKQHLH